MTSSFEAELKFASQKNFQSLKPNEALIFLHLMKTGGTSLFKLLREEYPKELTFHYGQKPDRTIEYFLSLPQKKRDHLKFLHGHLYYGFHNHLKQPCHYITMLREPINRVISLYYFLHHNPKRTIDKQARCETLKIFLEQGSAQIDNGQTRRIAGDISKSIPFGGCTSGLLDIAKQNLEKFLAVGITERFDESIVVLKNVLDIQKILYSKRNQNIRKPKLEEIDQRDIEQIKDYNLLDVELYEYANKLLDNSIEQFGDRFDIEFKLFSEANVQFSKAQSDLTSMKAKLKHVRRKLKSARGERKRLKAKINLKEKK